MNNPQTVSKHDPRSPKDVDTHVGSKLRLRRIALKMSQEKVGEALGVTFQQVQKYERGANRIAASRLYDLSILLDIPIEDFFSGLTGDDAQTPQDFADLNALTQRTAGPDLINTAAAMNDTQLRSLLSVARAITAPINAEAA